MINENVALDRNKDVVNSFYEGIREMADLQMTQEEVIRDILKKPAPKFYVTYERARRFISMMDRGMELPFTNKNKVSMYNEIFRRFIKRRMETHHPGYQDLEEIINEPAPSFYLNMKTFREIIYKSHKQKQKHKCK
jgi:hypothetical protein